MYILSIDQSTSSTKAILINEYCKIKGRINKDHKQYYPQSSWVEHDAEEIFNNLLNATAELIESTQTPWSDIAAISISNQRETVVVWDKNTGRPIHNAIVWQCARATELCNDLNTAENNKKVRETTGLMLSPYFSAAKIGWILDNVEGAKEKAAKGDLLAGTMDSWLIWKLTENNIHATDLSNASRTSLLNINTLDWDEDICNIFKIPVSMLASIKPSDTVWGETTLAGRADRPLPIAGVLGDSHAALFAQRCFDAGMAKATYGTGSSVMMNVGSTRPADIKGLVSSIGWGMKNEVSYVLEGNINSTGATIKWLADNLHLINDPAEAETEANTITDTDGVYLVPAFSGLSAPYWDNEARAIISGMSFSTTSAHIIRAGLEAIGYQIKDIINLMSSDTGMHLRNLRTDGGPTKNSFLMQFQSDILGSTVIPAQIEELSALGSAMMGGLAIKMWQDKNIFDTYFDAGNCYVPKMTESTKEALYYGWKEAVGRARGNYIKK